MPKLGQLLGTRNVTEELESDKEAAIVFAAKAADAGAWDEIYRLYYRPIFRYFLGHVGDKSICEDLTATVFLEAVKGIDSFVYRGTPLLAWLYRIARNVAADHNRRTLGRRPSGASGVPSRGSWLFRRSSDRPIEQEPAPASESSAGISVERMDLMQAMKGLSEQQREIVALHYYAGFSLREVARIIGVNERTVYSLQAKALVELRSRLVA